MKKKISAAKLLKKITKEKDLVWRIAVKERDKYECQVCQKKVVGINAQAHHLIPRSFKDFRWDIDNGICLCFSCHAIGRFSAHINGIFFAELLKKNRPELYAHAIENINRIYPMYENLLSASKQ